MILTIAILSVVVVILIVGLLTMLSDMDAEPCLIPITLTAPISHAHIYDKCSYPAQSVLNVGRVWKCDCGKSWVIKSNTKVFGFCEWVRFETTDEKVAELEEQLHSHGLSLWEYELRYAPAMEKPAVTKRRRTKTTTTKVTP